MAREKICGIYCIENLVNGKKYVGQSNNIYCRWTHHKWCLNNKKHPNSYLQNAWNKYGENNFCFTILKQCDDKIIDEQEKYYIQAYKTLIDTNGYNLDSGGNKNKHHSKKTKIKMSKSAIGRIISEETRRKISMNRKGKASGINHHFYGKKLSAEHIQLLIKTSKESISGSNNYGARKVICINTQEIFDTIKEAEDKYKYAGANSQNIGKCCNELRNYSGKLPNGEELQWAYYEKGKIYTYIPLKLPPSNNMKPVKQYDLDGNYITTYKSAREAERETGIGYKMISRVCNGGRPYTHGYVFKFEN